MYRVLSFLSFVILFASFNLMRYGSDGRVVIYVKFHEHYAYIMKRATRTEGILQRIVYTVGIH